LQLNKQNKHEQRMVTDDVETPPGCNPPADAGVQSVLGAIPLLPGSPGEPWNPTPAGGFIPNV